MAYKLHPEAEDDLADSYTFYEDRSPGLGDAFEAAIFSVFEDICERPGRYPFIEGTDCQYEREHRFHFTIVFRVAAEQHVQIIAVYHHAREPQGWQVRL